MTFIPPLLALSGIFLLACASPGPDFFAVTSNAFINRLRGLGVAVGTAMACVTWAALTLYGLGFLLARVAWLYDAVRLIGAAYLVYLGVKTLVSTSLPRRALPVTATQGREGSAVRTGFVVGITNPKTATFFGSLFVTILPADAPTLIQGIAVGMVGAVALGWFSLIAIVFSTPRVRSIHATLRRPIDALMGAILVGLGLRLAAAR